MSDSEKTPSIIPVWLPSLGKFILKATGWIAIGVLITFIASNFVELPPNRADLFTILEVMFGIIITALSIVAAFLVSSQWRDYESSIRDYSENTIKEVEKVKIKLDGTNKSLEKLNQRIEEIDKRSESVKSFINKISVLADDLEKRFVDLSNLYETRKNLSNLEKELDDIETLRAKHGSLKEKVSTDSETADIKEQLPISTVKSKDPEEEKKKIN